MYLVKEEHKVLKLQRATPTADYKFSAGIFVLSQVCDLLGKLFIQLSLRQHFIAQATAMSLHGLMQVPIPHRLLKVRPMTPAQGILNTSQAVAVSSFCLCSLVDSFRLIESYRPSVSQCLSEDDGNKTRYCR